VGKLAFTFSKIWPEIGPLFDAFWSRNPALLYGLALYLGSVFALSGHSAIYIPLALLFLPLLFCAPMRLALRLALAFALAVLFGFYVSSSIIYPPVWAHSSGSATIQITEITPEIRYNRAFYKMKVDLKSFEADDRSFYAQNFVARVTASKLPPHLDHTYTLRGMLEEYEGSWTLKIEKDSPWIVADEPFSLVSWRFSAKQFCKRLLASYLPPGQGRSFLEGVLIGEFHDALLANNLRRFGLQHITVVSGFHFSLIAAILCAILRFLLPWKATLIACLILTTGYFFFIGATPSVLRAWISVVVFIMAKLLQKRSSGINSLGLGLIITIFYDPTWVLHLSFTLSFLATWAILLLLPMCLDGMRKIFPRRTGSMLLKMSFLDQVTFVLLSFFLSSWALVGAVTILMLPMSLYVFQQFPLMGILYNCFFPFLVSVSVCLLVLGLLFCWLKPLAELLFWAASLLTDTALTFVNEAPGFLDVNVRLSCLSLEWLVLYLSLVSFVGIILDSAVRNGQEC
jgi:competence protein ComEC